MFRGPLLRAYYSQKEAHQARQSVARTCTSVRWSEWAAEIYPPFATGLRVAPNLGQLANAEWYHGHSLLPPFAYPLLFVTALKAYRKPFPSWHISPFTVITEVLSARTTRSLQSGMGRGLRPSSVPSPNSPFFSVCRYPDEWMDARGHISCDRHPDFDLFQQTVGLEQCGRNYARVTFFCEGNGGDVMHAAGG